MNSRFWSIILWIIIVLLGILPATMIFFMFFSPQVVDKIPYPIVRDIFNAITEFLTS